jgi:uncharacterized protein (DUF2252 family)
VAETTAHVENRAVPSPSAVPGDGQGIPVPEPIPIAPPLPTPKERRAEGKARRQKVPRWRHGDWKARPDRADPVSLLEQSSQSRLPSLVPIRYGRMLGSPFHFLRGSPIVMAHDLAATPVTGIRAQICGDAHLMNFGVYASPERNLLFDINDFDETLPGPWEWDVKRLASSLVVAGISYSKRTSSCERAVRACVRSYREHMLDYSTMHFMDVWYSRVDSRAALELFGTSDNSMSRTFAKSRRRTGLQALSKLAGQYNGRLRIIDDYPLVQHVNDPALSESLRRFFRGYYSSLQSDRLALVERYRFIDFALRVVGVGSVGTRCFIVLMDCSHSEDILFLQVKEAQASVLELYLGPGKWQNHGRRVVAGQRLMQSASDIFLGWSSVGGCDYYVRQLRDMKGAADLELMSGADLIDYASLCGWVLARAHARSGDAAMIAGYLGKGEAFDEAVCRFAELYAEQTNKDYEVFQAAVKSGRLPAEKGL